MASWVFPLIIAVHLLCVQCSPEPPITTTTTTTTTSCTSENTSWKVTDFEWRTGYVVWSYPTGGGPAPPPPPIQFYTCGEAMLRMNITTMIGSDAIESSSPNVKGHVIECVEQTNDAKLANLTDMADYNPGPEGPPPASPHWFTCDMKNQLFIFLSGAVDPWLSTSLSSNLTTKIRMDPVKLTLEIEQRWADNDRGSSCAVAGLVHLPPLTCRERTALEPDANFLINSPVMHGFGYGAQVLNGSVCTGPDFRVYRQ
ncbi:hypothetical protein F4808DRAFT_453328 [Astrocystis sublimbata]|nr:hypothetical protein F4808DRAFT_453328 [Astrocystis sublimbata]